MLLFTPALSCFLHAERHISIQAKLEDLEMLVDLTGGESRASSSWLGWLEQNNHQTFLCLDLLSGQKVVSSVS